MLSFLIEKCNCTGCGACKAACPADCIEFYTDEEGFRYPEASDKCINCNKCRNVCPVVNNSSNNKEQNHSAYAAVSKNYNVWKRSASGGAFSEICNAFGDEKTLVCGAVWDGFSVQHKSVVGVENIADLCKSKYVQSDTKNTYTEIKEHLNKGGKAIFCGTPCQVAGVKNYLGKDYDNLLLIDFICHGAGSPAVFEECIKLMESQFGKKIISYGFRAKRRVFEVDYLTEIKFADKNKSLYLVKDPYIQLFLSQNALRPCCGENCVFRNEYRYGDITIADFKGLSNVFPELKYVKKNYSSVIFNTEKGLSVKERLGENMEMIPAPMSVIEKYNPLFFKNTRPSEDRDNFFADFSVSRKEAVKKWTKPAKQHKLSIQRKVYDVLPLWIRRIMFKIFRGAK